MPRSKIRTPLGYRQIAHTLRAEILTGKLRAGQRLATYLELQHRFGSTPVTVHLAIRLLVADGFVQTKERDGMFVAEQLPHLTNYALVFPADPVAPFESESPTWSKYYQAITAAAVELQRELGPRLVLFHGIGYHADSEDRQRLVDHIHNHRLAGIIFANSPHALAGTPILDEPGIPRVVLASGEQRSHVPAITFDGDQWFAQALDLLHRHGRHRVAVLCFRFDPKFTDRVARSFAARGLTCPSYWQQAVDWRDLAAVNHCVQLLLRGPAAKRPDGLLVVDDNLVEGVTAGLVAAGLRVPADLDIVAHANYPLAVSPVLSFHVLGYDLGAALRTGLDLIDCQRRGERVAGLTTLPAMWRKDLMRAASRVGAAVVFR